MRALRETGAPDLVLLDINLPRLNGIEVLSRLRADAETAALPVIMLSASAQAEDVRRSYLSGANSYIQKPAAFEDFVAALAALFHYWGEVVNLPSAA